MAKQTAEGKPGGGLPTSFKKRLKEANTAWKAAKEKAEKSGGFGTEFEDGRYEAHLIGGRVAESNSGRMQIDFSFKFADGKYEGQIKHDYQGIETEQNLEFLGRRLTQLGYELPDSLDDIEDILTDIAETKPLCKIRIKTNGDFQNVYIDKVFAEAPQEVEEETDEAEAEEEAEEPEAEEAEEEEEEEEEAPAPAPAAKEGKKKKAAAPPPPVEEEEEEEEEEVDEEEEEEEEEQIELTKGMAVIAETAKGEVSGTVLEILEAENKVRVKLADGRTVRLPTDKISVSENVPEEPAAAPKKKTKK